MISAKYLPFLPQMLVQKAKPYLRKKHRLSLTEGKTDSQDNAAFRHAQMQIYTLYKQRILEDTGRVKYRTQIVSDKGYYIALFFSQNPPLYPFIVLPTHDLLVPAYTLHIFLCRYIFIDKHNLLSQCNIICMYVLFGLTVWDCITNGCVLP